MKETIDADKAIKSAIEKLDTKRFSKNDAKMVTDVLDKVVKEGVLPYIAMGFDDDDLERMYSYAFNSFKGGKFDEAIAVFHLLTLLKPATSRFVFALATALHKNKEYKEAATQYFAASLLDPTSPLPYYYAADCFVEMKELGSAIYTLNGVLFRCDYDPIYEPLKTRAEQMQKQLKKEFGWDEKYKKYQEEIRKEET